MIIHTFTCLAGVVIASLSLTAAQDLRPPDQEFVLEFESDVGPDGAGRLSNSWGGSSEVTSALELKNGFTLEGWVRIKESIPQQTRFFGKYEGPIQSGAMLRMQENGDIVFSASCEGVMRESRAPAKSIAARTWFHLAGTFDQDKLRLYVDGQLQSEEECPAPNWIDDLAFQVGGFTHAEQPSAAMRQIRVWNRALSGEELIAVAEAQLTGDEENLQAYWPLDDGGGDIARDLGPHGLDLQLGPVVNLRTGKDPRFVHTSVFDEQMQSGTFYPLDSISEFSYGDNVSTWVGSVLMDIDHDGHPDGLFTGIRQPNADCTTPIVPFVAFRNDGNGKFVEDTAALLVGPVEGTEGVMHPLVADFTGDGINDLFIVGFGWDTADCKGVQIRLLVGTQSGQLRDETAARLPLTPLLIGFGATEGDIDLDGDIDLFVYGKVNFALGETGKLQNLLLINDGVGNFSVDHTRFPDWLDVAFEPVCGSPQDPHPCNALYLIAELMDTDLDGDLDMVLLASRVGPKNFPFEALLENIPQIQILQVFQNDGSGNFTEGPRLPVREDRASSGERAILQGDFNSDGWPDFIYYIEQRLDCDISNGCGEWVENFSVDLLLNNGDGTFRDATDQLPNRNGSAFEGLPPQTVDFNRDGKLDLGYPSQPDPRHRPEILPWPAIYLNVGQGVFLDAAELIPMEAVSQRGFKTADLDQDGDTDLVSMNLGSNPSKVAIYLNTRSLDQFPDAFFTSQLDFAQFGDGRFGNTTLFSQVTLFHPRETSSATALLYTANDAGEPLSVDFNGEDFAGQKNLVVPAGGMKVLKTDGEGDIAVGSVQVKTDRQISGVILFGGSGGVAGVGASQVLNPGFLAPVETRADDGINTGVAIRNLSANPLTLNARLLQNGVALASAQRTGQEAIAGNGHLALFVDQFDWDAAVDFSDFTGLLEVTSSDRMVATIIQTHPNEFVTMPVVPLQDHEAVADVFPRRGLQGAGANHELHFAQFGDGAAGEDVSLFSQIFLINPDDQTTANAQVSMRDDDGNPLSVDLNGEIVQGVKNVQVGPRSLQILKTDAQGGVQVGSVTVSSDIQLAGVILFGGSVGVAGVGASEVLRRGFAAPLESNAEEEINTGIALMNLTGETVTLDLELVDPDGQTLATATLDGESALAPNGHLSLFVDQVPWDQEIDFSDFMGLIRVKPSGKIAATVVQTRPGQFATMPVAAL